MARRGISLVELMVAVTIIVVAILGSLGAQTMCRDLARTSRETNRAVGDLRAAMEELLLLSSDDIPAAAGPYAPGLPIARFTDLHLKGETVIPTYPNYAAGPVPDPLQITLVCRWTDHAGRGRSITFASVKTK